MNRIVLSISALLLCLQYRFAIADDGIPANARFLSPNGRYSIELHQIDGGSHFMITETATRRVDSSIVMPTVLLYLHWAANSQSIVTVEHIANGSYGRVIYSKGDRWMNVKVDPSNEDMNDSTVVGLEIKTDRVHYKFAVDYTGINGLPLKYKFCELDVDLKTGKMFNVKWKSINHAEWVASLTRNRSYRPPMNER